MTRTKIVFSILLTTIFLATQVVAVGAAPAAQDTSSITGTVVSITLETDPETNEVATVLVTLDVGNGVTQTVRLSATDATELGLLVDNEPVNPDDIDGPIEIDPALVILDEEEVEDEHPVGSAISDFFSDLLGVDYEMVMSYHDDGVGFGVIAQALWMTNALEGDDVIFEAIMEARQNKDYSGITLSDGSTPKNWGQFRQAVMKDREKAKENLGTIMSGHAGNGQDDTQIEPKNNGNAPEKDKGKDKEQNNNKNKDKGKDKEKGKDKDKNKDK